MIRLMKMDDSNAEYISSISDAGALPDSVVNAAKEIIKQVKEKGDEAVLFYNKKFDGVADDFVLAVTEAEIDEAYNSVDEDIKEAIRIAITNIKAFHKKKAEQSFNMITENGSILGSIVTPMKRVALYVPGGKAAYPSTVVMCAVPAIIAGVEEIYILTPPDKSGNVNKFVLATAKLLGIKKIFKAGGAQGVAAAAFGTPTIPKASKIVGPGNAYVAAAKREVFGTIDIDMIAGPSEILILADKSAKADWVAADMLSQAEHDEMARVFLITDSEELGKQVQKELENQLINLSREKIAKAAIENNSYILITDDMEKAADLANEIAPEHLELYVEKPFELLVKIKNAGAIFLGGYSPEPIGDYIAGPNHVLPTSGTAAFSSPLSVSDFVKRSSLIFYSEKDFAVNAPHAIKIAQVEGLDAHANAMKLRLDNK